MALEVGRGEGPRPRLARPALTPSTEDADPLFAALEIATGRVCERSLRGYKKLLARPASLAEALDQGLLPVEVFNDDRIFRAEMERIFCKTWVFMAHESHIPNKGDFVGGLLTWGSGPGRGINRPPETTQVG